MPAEARTDTEAGSALKPDSAKHACAKAPGAARKSRRRVPTRFRGGIYARCSDLISLAIRAMPCFNKAALEQEAYAKKMLARARHVDLKEEFLADRAHAAVKN